MLSTLHYAASSGRPGLAVWHDFMRRVPKVTKFHEFMLLPSYKPLLLHCQRSNYVLKLAMSAPWIQSPFLICFTQFGSWRGQYCLHYTWNSEEDGTQKKMELRRRLCRLHGREWRQHRLRFFTDIWQFRKLNKPLWTSCLYYSYKRVTHHCTTKREFIIRDIIILYHVMAVAVKLTTTFHNHPITRVLLV